MAAPVDDEPGWWISSPAIVVAGRRPPEHGLDARHQLGKLSGFVT